ncbi:hypothetical protein [Acanthopleuribacter pedis]|uniref:Uncharacterized protein n=1 Tax=Acanthopleuribacter pedis TaxID=442870 RepID=A0A8J7U7C7_9BACT|nr:hypothetical protein [Acanthopleuribacter pedis]MBO1321261.1 hypothetical protein [Acanthopleuribacter pedis]
MNLGAIPKTAQNLVKKSAEQAKKSKNATDTTSNTQKQNTKLAKARHKKSHVAHAASKHTTQSESGKSDMATKATSKQRKPTLKSHQDAHHQAEPKNQSEHKKPRTGNKKKHTPPKQTKRKHLHSPQPQPYRAASFGPDKTTSPGRAAKSIGESFGKEAQQNFENSEFYKKHIKANKPLTNSELLSLLNIYDSTAKLLKEGKIPKDAKIVDATMPHSYDINNPEDIRTICCNLEHYLQSNTNSGLNLGSVFDEYDRLKISNQDEAKTRLYQKIISKLGEKNGILQGNKNQSIRDTMHGLTIHLGIGLRKSLHNTLRMDFQKKFTELESAGFKKETSGSIKVGAEASAAKLQALGAKLESGFSLTLATEDSGQISDTKKGTIGLTVKIGDEKIASLSLGLSGSVETGKVFSKYGDYIEDKVLEAFDHRFGKDQYNDMLKSFNSLQKHLIMNKIFSTSDQLIIPETEEKKGHHMHALEVKESLKAEVAKYVLDISITADVATTSYTVSKKMPMLEALKKNPKIFENFKSKTKIPQGTSVLKSEKSGVFLKNLDQQLKTGKEADRVEVQKKSYEAIKDLKIDFDNFCKCHRGRKSDEKMSDAVQEFKNKYDVHSSQGFLESVIVTFSQLNAIHEAALPDSHKNSMSDKGHLYEIKEFEKSLNHPKITEKHVSRIFKQLIKGDKLEASLEFEAKLDDYASLGGKITYNNTRNAFKSDDNGESISVDMNLKGGKIASGLLSLAKGNINKFRFFDQIPQLKKADFKKNFKDTVATVIGGFKELDFLKKETDLKLTFNFGKSENDYLLEYMRFSSTSGTGFESPELTIPTPSGASASVQLAAKHEKTIAHFEILGSETLGYIQTKFNIMKENNPNNLNKTWQDFTVEHKKEFDEVFKNLTNSNSPIYTEVNQADHFDDLQKAKLRKAMKAYSENQDPQASSALFKDAGTELFSYLDSYHSNVHSKEDSFKMKVTENSFLGKTKEKLLHSLEK